MVALETDGSENEPQSQRPRRRPRLVRWWKRQGRDEQRAMFILGVLFGLFLSSMSIISIISGEWAPIIICLSIVTGLAILAGIVRLSYYVIPDKSK